MGWLYRTLWLSHVRNRSPNTVIVTSVAAGNDVAMISWDSLQKGHRKDARSQERRETMQAEHTSFLQEACTGRSTMQLYITYTAGHQVALLLTAENEKDSVEKTLSMTIYMCCVKQDPVHNMLGARPSTILSLLL